MILKNQTSFILAITLTVVALLTCCNATAQGSPCPAGSNGLYASWSKSTSASGLGNFSAPINQLSALPNFSWVVTGMPLSIAIGTDEPFEGGNSMRDIYGPADDATNLNIRIQPNMVSSGIPIPHSVTLTIQFDKNTPASGWGFALIDLDVDQVRFRARDSLGVEVPTSTLAGWFVQRFDADPFADGVNLPSWDDTMIALIGSESSSTTWRDSVEGGLDDNEAGAAWFQPNVSLSEISFEYESLQESANPSYHVMIASCSAPIATPTPIPISPTPTPTGTPSDDSDYDEDTIPDTTEGSEDTDNDQIPNYQDKDSDNDTILDSEEGTGDPDEDGRPDYLDRDSDGDDVADNIERDPDATTNTTTGKDENKDGVDDGNSDKTVEKPEDSDGDSIPNHLDQDSDNDNQRDGDEAYDLDGDGNRDVTPSGRDEDSDGLDDAFEEFDSPQDLNPRFSGGANKPLCKGVALKRKKRGARSRLIALANRVPTFSARALACGVEISGNLVGSARRLVRSMERNLATNFPDRGLLCPASVCMAAPVSKARVTLQAQAKQLYRQAKSAKLSAIAACGAPPHQSTRKRPSTETYLAQLQREIAKLPRKLSMCRAS